MQIESLFPLRLKTSGVDGAGDEGRRKGEKERGEIRREFTRLDIWDGFGNSKLFVIFGESFIRTAENSRCIIQRMPKFAEATRNETLYRYTSHIRVHKSRTENADDRISGQCRAAAVIFRINEAGYRGNNERRNLRINLG